MSETVYSYTHNQYHKGHQGRVPSRFVCIGLHMCFFRGTRRLRKLWRLADADNGLAYWHPRGAAWMVPVCKISEVG